ncbi:hypothetical protein BIW11_05785, partial [Tropilaelaps mercedesae]
MATHFSVVCVEDRASVSAGVDTARNLTGPVKIQPAYRAPKSQAVHSIATSDRLGRNPKTVDAVKSNRPLSIVDEILTTTTITEEPTTTLKPIRQSWAKIENGMKQIIDEQLRKLLPRMLRTSSEADMSAECQAANFKLFQGLRGLKAWASQ